MNSNNTDSWYIWEQPTSPNRGWLISPFVEENPIWVSFAAVIRGLLETILLFIDQQITAVVVNRKENKLKVCSNLRLIVFFYITFFLMILVWIQLQKGCGYHLDICFVNFDYHLFILGIPWFVATTVLSMTHVNSLKIVSETVAPGDKPQFLGVQEQRVTQISISVLCGLSVIFVSVLQRIPMPVFFGVLLYMGTSSLKGSQVLTLNKYLEITKFESFHNFLFQVFQKNFNVINASKISTRLYIPTSC